MTLREVFDTKIDKTDYCWWWMGSKQSQGYGDFRYEGKRYVAHRLSYELTYGPFPKELSVLHRCDNPSCVRPEHLFLGTQLDNMRDRMHKGRWKGGSPPGEGNGSAKLTDEQVRQIRIRRAAGEGARALGREFGVAHVQIVKIVQRKTWKHIE